MSAPWTAYLPKEEPPPPPPDPKAIVVWFADAADVEACLALRATFVRPFVGSAPPPSNVTWLCAGPVGAMRACCAFAPAGEGRIIVTDLYDDGTWVGKRGVLALIYEVLNSGILPFVVVPLDRPGLIKALEKRGMTVSGVSLELDRHG